jgi:predicted nucleic acid-binding protein
MTAAIVDTGPLVAFLDRGEQRHHWVAKRFDELDAPLLVCEPVLAEAMCLLARYPKAQDAVLELVQNGAMRVAFRIDEHIGKLRKLLQKYRARQCRSPMPASFAWRRSTIDMPS